jgi:HD-like signal output (HDOD) protein
MTQTTAPSEFTGRLSGEKDWREVVQLVADLPPMPQVAQKAMTLVENPATTANELADLLNRDPALAARVLKIANSAMFARQREITTLTQAIMVIGLKSLKGIVVAAAVRQISKSFGKLDKLAWEKSMSCAIASNMVAKSLKKRYVDEVFLIGLLHNLGQVVLIAGNTTRKEYQQVYDQVCKDGLEFAAAEQKIFGFSHALIGALVAKKWNFNPETCEAILHHRDPLPGPKAKNEGEEKTCIVSLAELVSRSACIATQDNYPVSQEELRERMMFAGYQQDAIDLELESLIRKVKEQYQSDSAAFG